MGETLLQTYTPLLVWTTVGAILLRVTPDRLPRLLARALFLVGVPLEILALARHTDLRVTVAIVPVALLSVVAFNLMLGWLVWSRLRRTGGSEPPDITAEAAKADREIAATDGSTRRRQGDRKSVV